MNPLAGIPSAMTCAECGHLPNDHVDRAFGIACCPSIATTGFRARLCECSGWVLAGTETGTGATTGAEVGSSSAVVTTGAQKADTGDAA